MKEGATTHIHAHTHTLSLNLFESTHARRTHNQKNIMMMTMEHDFGLIEPIPLPKNGYDIRYHIYMTLEEKRHVNVRFFTCEKNPRLDRNVPLENLVQKVLFILMEDIINEDTTVIMFDSKSEVYYTDAPRFQIKNYSSFEEKLNQKFLIDWSTLLITDMIFDTTHRIHLQFERMPENMNDVCEITLSSTDVSREAKKKLSIERRKFFKKSKYDINWKIHSRIGTRVCEKEKKMISPFLKEGFCDYDLFHVKCVKNMDCCIRDAIKVFQGKPVVAYFAATLPKIVEVLEYGWIGNYHAFNTAKKNLNFIRNMKNASYNHGMTRFTLRCNIYPGKAENATYLINRKKCKGNYDSISCDDTHFFFSYNIHTRVVITHLLVVYGHLL
jgi:hypothetical protein